MKRFPAPWGDGWSRRELLRAGALGLAAAACGAPPRTPSADALALHAECFVFDLHIDTPLWMRLLGYDPSRRHRSWLPSSAYLGQMDLPRARDGGLDGAVLGLVINPREVRDELILPLKLLAAVESGSGIDQTLETLDLIARAAEQHPDEIALCRSGSELRSAAGAGRFAALAGLEGSHGIESDMANVQRARDRGLRMLGLTHFQASSAAYPTTVAAFAGRGLTPFGRELVPELERLGIVIDLAHVNEAGVDEALTLAREPIVLSHTACRALRPSPRNTSDEQIRRVAEGGGVVALANGRGFVGDTDVAGYVDHIDHVIRVGGADTPALGTDFDGAIVPIAEMCDVSRYPLVTAELLSRGHTADVVRKVLGENALRVISDVTG